MQISERTRLCVLGIPLKSSSMVAGTDILFLRMRFLNPFMLDFSSDVPNMAELKASGPCILLNRLFHFTHVIYTLLWEFLSAFETECRMQTVTSQ